MEQDNKRILGADLLRIVAMLGVLFFHVSGDWRAGDISSETWLVGIIYDHLGRWAVPAFLAISGMTFLNPEKDITTKSLFSKYIPRIVIMFFAWSALYMFIPPSAIAQLIRGGAQEAAGIPAAFSYSKLFNGHYHMAYLLALLGCYICVPFLRLFTAYGSKRLLEGYLLLCFIFALLPPVSIRLLSSELPYSIRTFMDAIGVANFAGATLGYFVMGYYFKKYPLSGWREWALYLLGILSMGAILYFSVTVSRAQGNEFQALRSQGTATIALCTAAIFHFFIHRLSHLKLFQNEGRRNALIKAATLTSGVYMCHPYFIDILRALPFSIDAALPPQFGFLLFSLEVYLVSFVFAFIMSKIPLINKYCM